MVQQMCFAHLLHHPTPLWRGEAAPRWGKAGDGAWKQTHTLGHRAGLAPTSTIFKVHNFLVTQFYIGERDPKMASGMSIRGGSFSWN